jgi:thymidylate kinase
MFDEPCAAPSALPLLPFSRVNVVFEGVACAGVDEQAWLLEQRLREDYADGPDRVRRHRWRTRVLPSILARTIEAPSWDTEARILRQDFAEVFARRGPARPVQLHARGPWAVLVHHHLASPDARQRLLDIVERENVITVLLDLDERVAAARWAAKVRRPDPSRDPAEERQRYLALAAADPRTIVVPADAPPEDLELAIWRGVRAAWEAMSAAPARS